MKKLIISFLLLVFYSSFLCAQRWDSLAGGLNGPLPNPGILALFENNGNLYAGGFVNLSASSCIASWNGSNWSPLGDGLLGNYYPTGFGCDYLPYVDALGVFNGNLFAGGYFDTIIGKYVNAIAQWNGINWDSAGGGTISITGGTFGCENVNCFETYNGDLFAGGAFIYTGDHVRVNYITRWNGSGWNKVGLGVNGFVYCLAVYNGNLYAGGYFDSAGGFPAKNIAMWNGTTWSALGSGINNSVNALSVYNGSLIAGGEFDSVGGHPANRIARWNGAVWSTVGSGIITKYSYGGVNALVVYGSVLCVGGNFDTAGGMPANNIAYWDGSNWGTLGSGVDGYSVNALTTYNGALIAGGAFDTAGGIPANNIAQWTSPLGINELRDKSEEVRVYPNPNDGKFSVICHSEQSEESQLQIYNILGENVFTETLVRMIPARMNLSGWHPGGLRSAQGDNLINLKGQPNGLYFYRVSKSDGSLIGEGKIVIQK
jgi:hypothetical protein